MLHPVYCKASSSVAGINLLIIAGSSFTRT